MRFQSRSRICGTLALVVCGGIQAFAMDCSAEEVRQNEPIASVAAQAAGESDDLCKAYLLTDVVLVLNGDPNQNSFPKMCSSILAKRERVIWTDATYQYKLNQAGGIQKTLQKALPKKPSGRSAEVKESREIDPDQFELVATMMESDDYEVDHWIREELRINNIRVSIEGSLSISYATVSHSDAARAREILKDSRFFYSGALQVVEKGQ